VALLKRPNFKAIGRTDLEAALSLHNWFRICNFKEVDDVLQYIKAGIISTLDIVAPEREIVVKKGANLYLARDILELMKMRDVASGNRYRSMQNEVTCMVRRDKQASKLLFLNKANNNPKGLWSLADQALRKDQPSLHQHSRLENLKQTGGLVGRQPLLHKKGRHFERVGTRKSSRRWQCAQRPPCSTPSPSSVYAAFALIDQLTHCLRSLPSVCAAWAVCAICALFALLGHCLRSSHAVYVACTLFAQLALCLRSLHSVCVAHALFAQLTLCLRSMHFVCPAHTLFAQLALCLRSLGSVCAVCALFAWLALCLRSLHSVCVAHALFT
jgi:hypothetical protein